MNLGQNRFNGKFDYKCRKRKGPSQGELGKEMEGKATDTY